jgi:hypothetical protein
MKHRPTPARPGWPSLLLACSLLGACASKPPVPGWQINAKDSSERAAQAWLSGDSRVEAVEFERARREMASTGRADLLSRLELLRCATRVAVLELGPCTGFEALAVDAGAPERAYARYLRGQAQASDVALLPPLHQALAMATAVDAAALTAMDDPLSRLVAAGVLLQRGLASPAVVHLAVDTASAQGWRRPLLAWLRVQLQAAQASGAAQDVQRLQRRISLVDGSGR